MSAGRATGPARAVTDPADPRGLAGEVLLAPITDPWTPLFIAAIAVVVDVGATRVIADGDVIEVDGDRGVVCVVDVSSQAR